MSGKKLPEMILGVLLAVQLVCFFGISVFLDTDKQLEKYLAAEDYSQAAQIISDKSLSDSQQVKSWIASSLPDKLDKYSKTEGSKKAQELLSLVDVLIDSGYNVSEPLRECYVSQATVGNFVSGDVSALDTAQRLARVSDDVDVQGLYREIERFESDYLLGLINQQRAENGIPTFMKNEKLNSLCSELAAVDNLDSYDNDEIIRRTTELGINVSELSFFAADAGKCRTSDDFLAMLSDETKEKLTRNADYNSFGVGVVFDAETYTLKIFAEVIKQK